MMSYVLAAIAALCGLVVLVCGGATAWKWFVKGQNIRRSSPVITAVALALTVLTGIPAALMWPSGGTPATVNADNTGGWSITADEKEVNMSGFGTRAQVLAYLQKGFTDHYALADYDKAMTTLTEYNMLPVDASGASVDQAKIKENTAYLAALGFAKEYPNGFRNAVQFTSKVMTAEVINNLSNLKEDELQRLYDDFRWEINYFTMTSLRYADMRLQRMESFPEFNAQNDMWAPSFREILDQAKTDPEFRDSLYVDGHLREDVQLYCGMLCMSEESAVITGVKTLRSVVNWELPWTADADSRWTVALNEPDQQENLFWVVFDYPNLKSGQNAYKTGYNTADLRSGKFELDAQPVQQTGNPPADNPPSGKPTSTPTDNVPNNPTSRTLVAHFKEDGTGNTIQPDASKKFVVGKPFSYPAPTLTGWTYVRMEGTNSGDKMPDQNLEVTFFYKRNVDTSVVTLKVEHRDADTNAVLRSDGPYTVTKGSTHTLTADYNGSGYVYSHNSEGNSKSKIDVKVDANKTVIFYYYKEWQVTARYVDIDNPSVEVHAESRTYWRQGKTYTVSALTIPGWTYVKNSNGTTSKTVTGTTPANNNTVVTFYYKKNVASYTVTTIHRATDSGYEFGRSTQTVQAGTKYTTSASTPAGYHFAYTSGDPTSGTMPERNIEVTYWYTLDQRDGDGNNKNPDAKPGDNGTGNATEGIGPGHGTEDPYIPPVIHDTPEQKGDEPTANHRPTDNPGGQAAGSDQRQEVSTTPTEAIIPDNQNTESSGNGGQDHVVTVSGTDKVEGQNPPDKTTPAESNPVTSTTTNQTTNQETGQTTTTTTTVDVSGTSHSESLDWEP